jgi:hypothetical protein
VPEPTGYPPDEKAHALIKQLAAVEEQLEDDQLDPAEEARLQELWKGLRTAILREPPPPGFVRTPAGRLIPEAQWKVMSTGLTPPAPPPYAERERDRLLREINADARAGRHAPHIRRALMLKSRVSLMVERLADPETPESARKELGVAVDRAWLALANEHATTRAWVDLLECIEVVANGGAQPEQVRFCFEREHPEHAANLDMAQVKEVIALWNRPAGRPAKSSAMEVKEEEAGVPLKWKMACSLADSAGLPHLGAATLKRLWEEKRPGWLKSFSSKAKAKANQTR